MWGEHIAILYIGILSNIADNAGYYELLATGATLQPCPQLFSYRTEAEMHPISILSRCMTRTVACRVGMAPTMVRPQQQLVIRF